MVNPSTINGLEINTLVSEYNTFEQCSSDPVEGMIRFLSKRNDISIKLLTLLESKERDSSDFFTNTGIKIMTIVKECREKQTNQSLTWPQTNFFF